jgi:hypothetical protein
LANIWLAFLALVANQLRYEMSGAFHGRDEPDLRLTHLELLHHVLHVSALELLGLLQETLKGGVRSSFGELTHVALPYPLELARGTVQLGFALLEDTQGVLSVCVL